MDQIRHLPNLIQVFFPAQPRAHADHNLIAFRSGKVPIRNRQQPL